MIQKIITIIQEPRRESYWPVEFENYMNQIGWLVYFCAFIAVIIILIGIYRSMRVWFQGKYDNEDQKPVSFFFTLVLTAMKNIFSRSFPRRVYYSIGVRITKRKTMKKSSFIIHSMIMVGFIGAAISTICNTAHEYLFHEDLLVGPLYILHSFFSDLAGLLLFLGTLLALIRRYILEREYYTRAGYEDLLLLLLLLWVSISGFLIEATRILYGLNNPVTIKDVAYSNIDFEWFSFIGYPLALIIQSLVLPSNEQIFALHIFLYITHLLVSLTGAILLVYGKLFHVGVGIGNVFLKDTKSASGQLKFDPDGIKSIEDFTFYQLFEVSACMKCHFCHNYCPANDTGEPLSPLKIVQDIKNWGRKQYGLFNSNKDVPIIGKESGIDGDVLWACVTCYACVNSCPHLIEHVDMIVGMRASLIEEGEIPGTYATMLESVYNYGNIWDQPKRDRVKWLKDGDLPSIKNSESKLLWLPGDTLAYDPRNQKVARATYEVFKKAGIDYGTLGDAEKNDGNEMRRLGEEALFQMLAEDNIRMFKKNNVKRIITSSPHAFNTIKNEYPEYGGEFEVIHVVEFLLELIKSKRIKLTKPLDYEVTYHDPCYLGRYNGVYEAPRQIISLLPGVTLKEMPNHGQFSYCCGGGGGGMFRETPEWVKTRISEKRVLEAKTTLHSTLKGKKEEQVKRCILISACPFCISMLTDAVKTQRLEEVIEVKDLVELVLEAIE